MDQRPCRFGDLLILADNNELDNIGNPDSFVWYGTRVSLFLGNDMPPLGLKIGTSGPKPRLHHRECTNTIAPRVESRCHSVSSSCTASEPAYSSAGSRALPQVSPESAGRRPGQVILHGHGYLPHDPRSGGYPTSSCRNRERDLSRTNRGFHAWPVLGQFLASNPYPTTLTR